MRTMNAAIRSCKGVACVSCGIQLFNVPLAFCADAKLRWRFTRRYLARQPNLPFKRTKKLLNVKPTLTRKKRIAGLTAGPMKGIVAGARSPSGNKRKRSSNPPGRWQPGTCDRPYLWWHATLVVDHVCGGMLHLW